MVRWRVGFWPLVVREIYPLWVRYSIMKCTEGFTVMLYFIELYSLP